MATAQQYDPWVLLLCVIIVILFALIFDFSNGFHDTSNSIATCVGTRSMYVPQFISRLPYCQGAAVKGERREAVRSTLTALFAGLLNFLPVFTGEIHVAQQISSVLDLGKFSPGSFAPLGILCLYATLVSALFWNFLTWQYGLPSSSSHALIGSLVGAGLAMNGIPGITWSSVLYIVYGLLGSPAYASVMAFVCFLFCMMGIKIWQKTTNTQAGPNNPVFRSFEVVSTACLAWLHGANDAQKTMGIIAACLLIAGYTNTETYTEGNVVKTDIAIDAWVRYSCHAAIGIGTLFGGWSIVGKMALDIYPSMSRQSGLCANTGAMLSLALATYAIPVGLPVSTTQAMNFGILSAGVSESGWRAIQWKVMGHMILTWIFTIPATIFSGFVAASLITLPGAWSPFFCILLGVGILFFMVFCVYMQKDVRTETSLRVLQKYELSEMKDADANFGPPNRNHQASLSSTSSLTNSELEAMRPTVEI